MDNLISRQDAIDAIAKMMPKSYTPDGSHPADEEIFRAQEIYADCIETIEILPPAQFATDTDVGDKSISCSHENDLISRQAAIEKILGQPPEPHYPSWYAEQIRELPPAEPKRMRGRWVGADTQCGIACSVCGVAVDDFCHSADYIDLDYNPDFCPNCGADMRIIGEQNE